MFIEQYFLTDLSVCDKLIEKFETSNNLIAGKTGGGVQKNIKDSLDLGLIIDDIQDCKILKDYFSQLETCLNLYKKKYVHCDKLVSKWSLQNCFNIQKYKPSQAYHGWHSESIGLRTCNRHLVFMTYLNDVKQGGETEWYYQKLKIKPQKGLTVIWGSDWTFTHKGHTTINEDKYIITGWFEFKK